MTGRRVFLEHTQGGLDFFWKEWYKNKIKVFKAWKELFDK